MFKKEDFTINGKGCLFAKEARDRFILEYEKCAGSYELEDCLRYQIRQAVADLKQQLLENTGTILKNIPEEQEEYAEFTNNH